MVKRETGTGERQRQREREAERQRHRDRGQREGDGVRGNTHETANIFKLSQTFHEESKKKPANKTKGKKCFLIDEIA